MPLPAAEPTHPAGEEAGEAMGPPLLYLSYTYRLVTAGAVRVVGKRSLSKRLCVNPA